jgi:hypothetical protein
MLSESAKKPTDKTPLDEKSMFLPPAFSLCTSVEPKLSLRTRLARQTHARCMHNRREVYCQSSPSALLTEAI